MKSINFNDTIPNTNESYQVNEFLVTALACVVLGNFISTGIMNVMNNNVKAMEEFKKNFGNLFGADDRRKRKEEKERAKAEKEKQKQIAKTEKNRQKQADEKEMERAKAEKEKQKLEAKQKKETEKAMKRITKQTMAMEKEYEKLPEGKDKEELGKALERFNRAMRGEGTKEDMEAIEKESKRELTKDEQNIRVGLLMKTNKISDEDAEVEMKKRNYTPDNLNKTAKSAGLIKEEPEEETNDQGEVIKDMEVEDPGSGKKVIRKVHIGPRGGKYYWPDGKPHDEKHKVYINK